ncbi:hydantoinase B/oxoprolinase family protein [Paenisporosarcina antarctica]|uniref:Hydantoinase B/oxoprolinase family protein n=2 Tax=Paenisporosarcina antarctica TaxID=417367 RepID=A0A4P7A1P8_9BACL|nr:hydantoinase B/oxoprolinase family protein [Paenisporosarcina antarctica]
MLIMTKAILIEVINNALKSVAEQMTETMVRSSYSTIVKEMRDCSSAIFDKDAQMLAEGANIPIHLNCLGPALNTILTKFFPKESFKPGDIVLTNHPYAGGESLGSHHTKDIIMVAPIFLEESILIGYSVTMLHHRDVGGVWTGDSWTEEIWQEGFLMEPVKLYDAGVRNEALWRVILNNTRVPHDMKGDLLAQISGCNIGSKGLTELVNKYGYEETNQIFDALLMYSEKLTCMEIKKMEDGVYFHEEKVLDDGYKGGPYTLKLKVIKEGENITFDFTGTDPQIKGPINSPLSATISAVYYTLKTIIDPSIPVNDGCHRPITVIAPKGTLVNAQEPIGCFQRMVTAHVVVDLIMGALSTATRDRVIADSCGCLYDFCSAINMETHPNGGEVSHRQYWGEIVPGGLGARPNKDGISVMSCHVTNCPIPPMEAQEIESPVIFLERSIVPDSGGPGKYRGGLAHKRKWKIVGYEAQFFHTSQKSKIPPQGLFGGKPGKSGRWTINEGTENERVLEFALGDVIFLNYGDTVTLITPGGGGYGNPFERNHDLVLEDVRQGYVSIESAKLDYGIVIDPEKMEINEQKTENIRK